MLRHMDCTCLNMLCLSNFHQTSPKCRQSFPCSWAGCPSPHLTNLEICTKQKSMSISLTLLSTHNTQRLQSHSLMMQLHCLIDQLQTSCSCLFFPAYLSHTHFRLMAWAAFMSSKLIPCPANNRSRTLGGAIVTINFSLQLQGL